MKNKTGNKTVKNNSSNKKVVDLKVYDQCYFCQIQRRELSTQFICVRLFILFAIQIELKIFDFYHYNPSQLLRFYSAMSGLKGFMYVSKYDHMDFLDQSYRKLALAMCPSCSKNCDYSQYRILLKEMILSFADAILNKDALALKYIEQGKFSIEVAYKHDYMGYDPLQGGFCKRLQESEEINLSVA